MHSQYQVSSTSFQCDSLLVMYNYTTFSNPIFYDPLMNIFNRVSPYHLSLTHSVGHPFQVSLTASYWIGHPSQIPFMFIFIKFEYPYQVLLISSSRIELILFFPYSKLQYLINRFKHFQEQDVLPSSLYTLNIRTSYQLTNVLSISKYLINCSTYSQ